jgi:hypothetical protein
VAVGAGVGAGGGGGVTLAAFLAHPARDNTVASAAIDANVFSLCCVMLLVLLLVQLIGNVELVEQWIDTTPPKSRDFSVDWDVDRFRE